jgi:hypothetical protein
MRWLRQTELRTALIVSWVLVVARSLVYAVFAHAHFDSDQAIVGLMAKHLSEGRAFPLFFYGQSYMLAVEAWLAVPFFWVAGATVAALRASLIVTNLGVVSLLIVGLHRWGGLRPYLALVAALFVAFAPPATAADLLEAQGGNIEPFLWILLLWFVRERPFWFGSLLAVGFLNREFVIYAVPVLVAGQLWSRTLFRMETWRAWLFSLIAFLAVWQSVQALMPLSDWMGPGTRGATAGATRGQLQNLSERARFEVQGLPTRTAAVVTTGVAGLLGGRNLSDAPQGRNWVGYLLGLALLAAVVRLALLPDAGCPKTERPLFAWYVLGIGIVAAVAYAVTRPGDEVIRRYILLTLFIPVGLVGLWLTVEPNRRLRQAVAVFVLGWASIAAVDHWRQFDRFRSGQVPDPMCDLVSALGARGVSVAEAPYWRAYKLTFLMKERVKVASTDVVRIAEYQRLASAAGADLVRVQEEPCAGGTQVGAWYLCQHAR